MAIGVRRPHQPASSITGLGFMGGLGSSSSSHESGGMVDDNFALESPRGVIGLSIQLSDDDFDDMDEPLLDEDDIKFLRQPSKRELAIYVVSLVAGIAVLLLFISASFTTVREPNIIYLSADVEQIVRDMATTEFVCPGSPAILHASARVSAFAQASCGDVVDEIIARVNAQGLDWTDPHNNGTYDVVAETQTTSGRHVVVLKRRTSDQRYTDMVTFVLESTSPETCTIMGCSEAQSASLFDFSNNYCNLHNLYCSSTSEPSCSTVRHDIYVEEGDILPSYGAGANPLSCSPKKQLRMNSPEEAASSPFTMNVDA
mmetsp:Transcript_17249/g.33866  ORF Transcript_17249/g.33866 Transcript_17249/m.33866 type:complete len:315 (-) Transcript_17249:667-1611(-)|eukprot:CAMPEP_0171485844 /NCGR_PEP_ID=MMETSP0958-20121227/766_1 /TAXON_ID=87120 /ORGANISM="Aurantiochytrium limacinum, Strain ATCCMYA-1381" /LENGTH=314 /DNA_ID=CAMNT_0012018669 /DNA_START=476 /DNA_END=1420 /DNA_ORIENTATION=+